MSSYQQSFLSSPRYGYDFVVATSQGSINATMKQYLAAASTSPVVVCWVADDTGNPVPMDYETLKQAAEGADPFTIPSGADPSTNQDLKNLIQLRFMAGFKATLGLPPGYAPSMLPPIVTLGSDTSAVGFNLLCSSFTAVQFTPGGWGPPTWFSASQQPGQAWIFSAKVDLRLTPGAAFGSLPPDVQAQIKDLDSNAFSIQQLLFDLDNAGLQSMQNISGVSSSSTLKNLFQQMFLNTYVDSLKSGGNPVLGYAVTKTAPDASSLTMTDLNFETLPLVDDNGQDVASPSGDQQNAATLNYLCATGHKTLPPATAFSWNWLEPADMINFSGVVAVNRNTFAKWFSEQPDLLGRVNQNCYKTAVNVSVDKLVETNFWWQLSSGASPTVSLPASGPTVLEFSWQSNTAEDEAGFWPSKTDAGEMKLSSGFNLSVVLQDDSITITQRLTVWCYLRSLQTSQSGNLVDKTIIDVYPLTVDAFGRLATPANPISTVHDNSENPSVNGFLDFFTGLNSLISDIADWSRKVTATRLTDIPVAIVQDFVFPGGKTFTFKDGRFSDNQDLIAHITYSL